MTRKRKEKDKGRGRNPREFQPKVENMELEPPGSVAVAPNSPEEHVTVRELSPEPEDSSLVKMEPPSESEIMSSPPESEEIPISSLVRALFQARW